MTRLASNTEFEAMLKKALKERAEAIKERTRLMYRIESLNKTIDGLSSLCKRMPKEPEEVSRVAQEMLKHAGFTDAVKMVLQSSPVPLGAKDIVAVLESISYPLEGYESPRTMTHVVLGRLVQNGLVERKPEGNDVVFTWAKK